MNSVGEITPCSRAMAAEASFQVEAGGYFPTTARL